MKHMCAQAKLKLKAHNAIYMLIAATLESVIVRLQYSHHCERKQCIKGIDLFAIISQYASWSKYQQRTSLLVIL